MSVICGIADLCGGIFQFEILKNMSRSLKVYGQKSSFAYINRGVGLQAENEAKNYSVKVGKQGNLAIVFDGELDNKKELASPLSLSEDICSAELAISLYSEIGSSALNYFSGEFALAIYDEPQRALILSRDKKGAKPLFYTLESQTLIFASEYTALLCASASRDQEICELKAGCFAAYSPFGLEIRMIGEAFIL